MSIFRRKERGAGAAAGLADPAHAPKPKRAFGAKKRAARGTVYAPEPNSSLTVIEINGRSFVAGLTWMTLTRYAKYMSEAREIGKQRGMDMVAIRRSSKIQAGFAPKSRVKLRGMYSLAAALCGSLGEDWIGAFELEDGRYALIAVNGGSVMAGRDRVASLDEVRDEFGDVYQLVSNETATGWRGRIVAPPEVYDSAEHLSLAELLPKKVVRPEHRLRQLTLGLTKGELIAIGGGIATLAVGTLAFQSWRTGVAEREAEELAELNLAEQLQRAKAATSAVVIPWEITPPARTFVATCKAAVGDLPLSVGGWVLREALCDLNRAVATYARPQSGSTVAVFVDVATTTFGQAPAVIADGAGASIFQSLSFAANGPDELLPMGAVLAAATSHLQKLEGIAEGIIQAPPVPDVLPGSEPPPAPEWEHRQLTVTTGMSPDQFIDGLPPNGLRITELHVVLDADAGALTWNITGDIYGR